MNERTRSFHLAWSLPAAIASVLYATWSITRYERFGAGAWDLGCRSQSLWLLAHARGFTSTVLGDVNFMGDHFMPSLILLAPLAWAGSPALLLAVQAALIAAGAWPLALLCRRRGLPSLVTFGVVVAYLFAVGTQSTANFDFHEVALLPFALLLAIWALEERRRSIAYAALVVAAGSRETAIAYAAAIGLWLAAHRGRRIEGLALAAVCLVAFVGVITWVQPRLLRGAPLWMLPMARFSTADTSLGDAVMQALRHPLQTVTLLVSPVEKVRTLAITFGGFAFFPFLAPDALIAATPNILERFLSDNKPEMWGIGYHYSLVLTAFAAFATVVAADRARRAVGAFAAAGPPVAFDAAVCGLLVVSTVAASVVSMPVGVELASLGKPYFASPEQTEINRRALAHVPAAAAVAAQNHFLAHLAMRERAWLPEPPFIDRADYVVLDPTQSAWPRTREHVERLIAVLSASPAFDVVFRERATIVFARRPR